MRHRARSHGFGAGPAGGADRAGGGRTAWTVEAVKQVRYHVVRADGLFGTDNTQLLTACAEAPLRLGDRRLVVIDRTVDALHGEAIAAYAQPSS